MRRLSTCVVVLALAGLVLVSCKGETKQGFSQENNDLVAVLDMVPYPPVAMDPTSLGLSLTGSNGEAIEGAQVAYDLTMPGMTMPPNNPQAQEQGRGKYLAEVVFTMAGEWRAQAIVEAEGETTTFTFEFSVK